MHRCPAGQAKSDGPSPSNGSASEVGKYNRCPAASFRGPTVWRGMGWGCRLSWHNENPKPLITGSPMCLPLCSCTMMLLWTISHLGNDTTCIIASKGEPVRGHTRGTCLTQHDYISTVCLNFTISAYVGSILEHSFIFFTCLHRDVRLALTGCQKPRRFPDIRETWHDDQCLSFSPCCLLSWHRKQ